MRRSEAIARAALAMFAIVLVAWFAVLTRNDHVGEAASHRILIEPNMSDADWTRTMNDLQEAEGLKPGTDWKVTRASYLLLRDKPAALRLAGSITSDEPASLDGWAVVLRAARGSDSSRSAQAAREMRRLFPLEQR